MNATMKLFKPFLTFLLIIEAVFWLGASTATVHVNRRNSLGADEVYTNHNTYILGALLGGSIMESDNGSYTSIRVQPYATPALYDESLLFCGDQGAQFNGKRGVVVITYETRAHKMFKGVACHELISVFEVPEPKQ